MSILSFAGEKTNAPFKTLLPPFVNNSNLSYSFIIERICAKSSWIKHGLNVKENQMTENVGWIKD